MNFLADESVDGPIILRLRQDGHEVGSIAEDSPGLQDHDVLGHAYRERVVLISADKDFGELVFRHQRPHAGVLLLRLSGLIESEKCDLVSRAILERAADFSGAFSVLERDSLRIRRDPNT